MPKSPQPMPPLTPKLIARFRKFYSKISECWEWQGCKQLNGYGRFSCKGRFLAHRFAWYIDTEEDPIDYWVRHTCGNNACVNPDHLYLDKRRVGVKKQEALYKLFALYSNEFSGKHVTLILECDESGELMTWGPNKRSLGVFDNFEDGIALLEELE